MSLVYKYSKKDFALGYAKLLECMNEVCVDLTEAKTLYDQYVSLTTLEIWSNKSYLKDCAFSNTLRSEIKVDLSNDTLRKSALALAVQYDSGLARLKMDVDTISRKFNILEATKESLGVFLDLSEQAFGEVTSDQLPVTIVNWLVH